QCAPLDQLRERINRCEHDRKWRRSSCAVEIANSSAKRGALVAHQGSKLKTRKGQRRAGALTIGAQKVTCDLRPRS
ncbi:hypothetical protein ACSTLK_23775, partial [Vibrio parahaemolyticus]